MDNLDQTKRELMDEVKGKLIEELNLEEITPEDIDNEAPLFGDCLLYTSPSPRDA